MIRICCRCKIVMGEKEPLDDKSETHGLCDECLLLTMHEIEVAQEQINESLVCEQTQ